MAQDTHKSRVLLADGQLLFRQGLRALLSAEKYVVVVGETASLREGLLAIEAANADILVADLDLVRGEERTVFAMRQARPSLALLLLTREDTPEQLEAALAAGARGYMPKGSRPEQFVAAVRSMRNAASDMNPRSLPQMLADLHALAKANARYPRPQELTSREQEVLGLLAQGMTVREVSLDLMLSSKTVEAHKLNLMRKLDIHNRSALMEYAAQQRMVGARVAS